MRGFKGLDLTYVFHQKHSSIITERFVIMGNLVKQLIIGAVFISPMEIHITELHLGKVPNISLRKKNGIFYIF